MWDQRLVRLALLQQLRAVYGIKVKGGRGQCDRRRQETAALKTGGKVFGVPFSSLHHSVVPEYGHIPSFLVDACTSLEEHVHTEGLFRKSGSVIRLRALKSKLDHGESCLSSALPCDIAGLLKQFFRDLPEPILPADLQEALFKAQQLGTEEKNEATLLLSCLMADHTIAVLRYFFNFLRNVSLRSSENRMDSSNLAVIFAPNLLQTSEGHEKMSANTEKKLRLQAAVVQTFIDHASDIDFILEKIPAMLGIDGLCATPSLEGFEESNHESPGECKRKRRQSVGDFVNGALSKLRSNRTPSFTPQRERAAQVSVSPMILTPSAKRKLPVESSHGFSSKKRKSSKHSFNLELLPSSLFSSGSTPVSVHLDSSPDGPSQSSLSPKAISGNQISTGVQRRSQRIAGKKVCRVESGKSGCFSPKISRKEKVRRSLRLKFSLGKSNRDVNGCSCSGVNRCENVGRRLANQQSLKNGIESVKTGLLFSPEIDERLTKKGSKKISKSEENLLTPERLGGTNYRMSWTGPSNSTFQEVDANETSLMVGNLEVVNSSLEPDLAAEKSSVTSYELTPSSVHNKYKGSVIGNTLSGDESNLTTETLVKIQKAFSESGSNLHELINHRQLSITNVGKVELNETSYVEYSPEKNLFETHDLTVVESEEKYEHHTSKEENSFSERGFSLYQMQNLGKEATLKCHATQMKMEHEKGVCSDTPKDYSSKHELPRDKQLKKQESPRDQLNPKGKEDERPIEENLVKRAAAGAGVTKSSSSEHVPCRVTNVPKPQPVRIVKQHSLVRTRYETVSQSVQVTEHGKVSDHIQWFNQLSLNEPNRTNVKSPLKFQRTPVRQSVRRINSLLEYHRQAVNHKSASHGDAASPLVKAVSCDSALSWVENASSIPCNKSGVKEQKSMSHEQPNVDAVSKSSMELTSKSSSKTKRHRDLVNASLGSTRICKQEVVSHDLIKVPLDDVTNYDILKSVVNNNTAFSPGVDNRGLRKPSERERAWYKGSPKAPIGKTQLLSTSKPVDL